MRRRVPQRGRMGRGRGACSALAGARRPTRRKQTRSAPGRWTHDSDLYRQLRPFTQGRTTFPTRREFDDAYRSDLRGAVDAYGGFEYWAEQLGLPLSVRQRGAAPYSEDEMLKDVRTAMEFFGHLPGARRLRANGFGRLVTRVQAAGGLGNSWSATHSTEGSGLVGPACRPRAGEEIAERYVAST